MSPHIFIYGFVGGFLLNFVSYFETIKDPQPEKYTEESNEAIKVWNDFLITYNVKSLLYCFVYGVIGGVLACVLNPQSPLLAFYIGMTAYPTLSKFEAVLYAENKLA